MIFHITRKALPINLLQVRFSLSRSVIGTELALLATSHLRNCYGALGSRKKEMKNMKTKTSLAGLLFASILAIPAHAALVNLGLGSFAPTATEITFSEPGRNLGDVDPVYNFTGLSGLGDTTVSFGGTFTGQTVTGGGVVTLDNTVPTGPLSLAGGSPTSFIASDGANPTSPVLSGSPKYNGPISVLFSQPVAGVGLSGGYFNAIGGTSIEAYAADGTSLGSITNGALGIEFYGLADSTGNNVISGISFYITGGEPAGFAIDNLTFGAAVDIDDPDVGGGDNGGGVNVPDGGSSLALLSLSVLGLAGARRAKSKRTA